MKRFHRMLSRLEFAQKDYNPELLFKDLWIIPGQWSNTTRGMLLSMLPADIAKEVKASHVQKKD